MSVQLHRRRLRRTEHVAAGLAAHFGVEARRLSAVDHEVVRLVAPDPGRHTLERERGLPVDVDEMAADRRTPLAPGVARRRGPEPELTRARANDVAVV